LLRASFKLNKSKMKSFAFAGLVAVAMGQSTTFNDLFYSNRRQPTWNQYGSLLQGCKDDIDAATAKATVAQDRCEAVTMKNGDIVA
jgi:hypothetical protein